MRRKVNRNLIVVLILTLTIGFAVVSTNLIINGRATVEGAKLGVKFANRS